MQRVRQSRTNHASRIQFSLIDTRLIPIFCIPVRCAWIVLNSQKLRCNSMWNEWISYEFKLNSIFMVNHSLVGKDFPWIHRIEGEAQSTFGEYWLKIHANHSFIPNSFMYYRTLVGAHFQNGFVNWKIVWSGGIFLDQKTNLQKCLHYIFAVEYREKT